MPEPGPLLCHCGHDRAACGACGRGWAQHEPIKAGADQSHPRLDQGQCPTKRLRVTSDDDGLDPLATPRRDILNAKKFTAMLEQNTLPKFIREEYDRIQQERSFTGSDYRARMTALIEKAEVKQEFEVHTWELAAEKCGGVDALRSTLKYKKLFFARGQGDKPDILWPTTSVCRETYGEELCVADEGSLMKREASKAYKRDSKKAVDAGRSEDAAKEQGRIAYARVVASYKKKQLK